MPLFLSSATRLADRSSASLFKLLWITTSQGLIVDYLTTMY